MSNPASRILCPFPSLETLSLYKAANLERSNSDQLCPQLKGRFIAMLNVVRENGVNDRMRASLQNYSKDGFYIFFRHLGEAAKLKVLNIALCLAADKGDYDFTQKLIQYGAQVNHHMRFSETYNKLNTCAMGSTPLMYATNRQVAKLLIDAGADIEAQNDLEQTPLVVYIQRINSKKITDLTIIKNVISKATVNRVDKHERTPLILASLASFDVASGGEIVNRLIEEGAIVDSVDSDRWTALTHAIFNAHVNNVAVLLRSNANANYTEPTAKTPLLNLAIYGINTVHPNLSSPIVIFHDIIISLLQHRADPNKKDFYGDSPLICAARSCHISKHLSSNNIILSLVGARALVNDENNKGKSPLMLAAEIGNLENIKCLLSLGANPNHKDRNGKSVLMYAVNGSNADCLEIVKTLIYAGADIRYQFFKENNQEFSVLSFARNNKIYSYIKDLLDSKESNKRRKLS